MKTENAFALKTISAIVIVNVALLASCSKNNDAVTSTDSDNINSESVSSSYTDETSDISNNVIIGLSSAQFGSGRVSASASFAGIKFDARLKGATVTIIPSSGSTLSNPQGTITIDFGSGQTVGNVTRSGEIIIAYSGLKWAAGSTRIITYSNYRRNNVKIEGTLIDTNTSGDSTNTGFSYTHAFDGSLVFFNSSSDSIKVNRTSNFTVSITFVPYALSYTGSASGTTKGGKNYATTIVTPLTYTAACVLDGAFIPVSGEKTITVSNGNSSTVYAINYGAGSCDNSVTVSVNGGKEITINAGGN